MRHSTWLTLQSYPLWQAAYGAYRKLPSGVRGLLRWFVVPRWELAIALVMRAAQERVVAGPFQGMNIPLSGVSKRLLPSYVLGSTELELRDLIERLIASNYSTIINVGAADGYYAVGFARRSPMCRTNCRIRKSSSNWPHLSSITNCAAAKDTCSSARLSMRIFTSMPT